MQFRLKLVHLCGMVLAAALWFAAPASAAAEIYHVSPTGNDSNPGSEDAPWLTLSHAAEIADAGDTVYIHTGVYTEPLRPRNSGTEGAPIVFTAYPGDTPVIDGEAKSATEWGGLVEINKLQHIEISNLRLINGGYFGVMITGSDKILIQDNEIDYTYSSGIYISNSRYVIVDGNDIQRACHGVGGAPPHYAPQEHITVRNGTEYFEITNNTVSNPHNGRGKEGINVKEGVANGKVSGNRVFGMSRTGLYVDAYDAYVRNIEISGNEVHNSSHGLVIASEQGGTVDGITVIDNLFYTNEHNGLWITGYLAGGPMRNLLVENNTLYGNGDHGVSVTNRDTAGIVIRNNIVLANATSQIEVDRGVPSPLLSNNFTQSDAHFVDPARGDFRLRPGSPAAEMGAPARP